MVRARSRVHTRAGVVAAAHCGHVFVNEPRAPTQERASRLQPLEGWSCCACGASCGVRQCARSVAGVRYTSTPRLTVGLASVCASQPGADLFQRYLQALALVDMRQDFESLVSARGVLERVVNAWRVFQLFHAEQAVRDGCTLSQLRTLMKSRGEPLKLFAYKVGCEWAHAAGEAMARNFFQQQVEAATVARKRKAKRVAEQGLVTVLEGTMRDRTAITSTLTEWAASLEASKQAPRVARFNSPEGRIVRYGGLYRAIPAVAPFTADPHSNYVRHCVCVCVRARTCQRVARRG